MREKRSEDRHHLVHYLRVFEQDSGREIGNIVNINKNGIMILSGDTLEEGKLLHLRLDFPEEIKGKYWIEFNAETRWIRSSSKYGLIAMGLKSYNIRAEDLQILEYLISFYQDDNEEDEV